MSIPRGFRLGRLLSEGSVASRAVTLILVAVMVGAACAPAQQAPGAGQPGRAEQPAKSVAADGAPKSGGQVIIGEFADAKTLSSVLSTDANSALVLGRVYESLIRVDPKTAEPIPRLAESFTVSPDSKTLTFTLRDGLTWSDGSPFSGEDFKFTAEAVMRSKKTVRKPNFQDVVGARAFAEGKAETISGIRVEGKVITVELERPFCPALTDVGLFGIIPKSVFGKYMDPNDPSKNVDDAPENNAPPLAMGPFKFREWKPNESITLERNERFFGDKPPLDRWIYKVYPDANAVAAAVKTGELDIARVEPKDLEDVRRTETLNVFSYAAPVYTYIAWNSLRGGKEFFRSKAVRQALAYGLNMDQVIERLVFGEGTKMLAHTPPVSWAYNPEGLNEYKYDPQKAKQLLEQDGWTLGADGIYQKGGQKLEFTMFTNSGNKVREALLQVAVEQYRQIGVEVTPRTESFEALTDRGDRKDPTYGAEGGRDFDAMILGWSLTSDPDAYSIWHSSQAASGFNRVGYKNPAVDAALEQGRTRCSTAERTAAYKTFNQQLNEDQPYNFGFAQNTLLAANKKVQGIEPGPFPNYYNGYLWNVERWWIK